MSTLNLVPKVNHRFSLDCLMLKIHHQIYLLHKPLVASIFVRVPPPAASKLSYGCFSNVLYHCYCSLLSLPQLILSISYGHQTLSFPCSVTQLFHSHFLDYCFTPMWCYGSCSDAPATLLLPCVHHPLQYSDLQCLFSHPEVLCSLLLCL